MKPLKLFPIQPKEKAWQTLATRNAEDAVTTGRQWLGGQPQPHKDGEI